MNWAYYAVSGIAGLVSTRDIMIGLAFSIGLAIGSGDAYVLLVFFTGYFISKFILETRSVTVRA